MNEMLDVRHGEREGIPEKAAISLTKSILVFACDN
jgi:hypothetical protein